MSQTVTSRASEPPPSASEPLPSTMDALLEELDLPVGARALVVGYHTLDMLCGLIRRGCAGGSERRPNEHAGPRPEAAEIAVVSDPGSVTEAATSVAIARRALTAGGRIAICDAKGLPHRALVALLRTHGFLGICTRRTPAGFLVLGSVAGTTARV